MVQLATETPSSGTPPILQFAQPLDKVQYIGRKFTPRLQLNMDVSKLALVQLDAGIVTTDTNTIIPMAIVGTGNHPVTTATSIIFENFKINPNFQKRDGEFKLRLIFGNTVVESTPFRIDFPNDDLHDDRG